METASTNANFALEQDGRKAILTFTREDRLNALDTQTFRDLQVTLEAIEADREVGVVIITGRGRAFVAGADITGYSDRTVLEYVEFQCLGRLVYDRIELSATADAREGIAAFIEKRPPEFTGH